jgi:PhnB protein
MNLYRELSMKAAVLAASWRRAQRWARRQLSSAHPGERADRGTAALLTSAMAAKRDVPVAETLTRTLAEQRRDEMNAQGVTLDAARTAWEEHSRSRVRPAIDAGEQGVLFKTPVPRVPQGFHSITPNIIVHNADKAIDFLKRAFGIQENYRLTTRDGKVAHCELQLEDSIVNLGESMDGWPAHGLVAQIHVKDSDASFRQALMAGATAVVPMADMFFGSREGRVVDPFGNVWIIATRTEEVSPQEIQRRMTAQGY